MNAGTEHFARQVADNNSCQEWITINGERGYFYHEQIKQAGRLYDGFDNDDGYVVQQ